MKEKPTMRGLACVLLRVSTLAFSSFEKYTPSKRLISLKKNFVIIWQGKGSNGERGLSQEKGRVGGSEDGGVHSYH